MKGKLVREWLLKAEEDYQAALALSQKRKQRFFNSVCFHSQQAAEKYFKAYLSSNKAAYPKTHDLKLLRNLCSKIEGDFEFISDLAEALNPYSVEFRYPGEQANRQDAKMALKAVKEIREFVLGKLE